MEVHIYSIDSCTKTWYHSCNSKIVLGIIPLIIFLISPETNRALNGVMFGLMIMGLTSPYPDYFNVYQVLKQTKKGCLLQFEKDDLYAISASDLK
ncbi:MAG: hypothetical protein HFJ97_07555 [Eubacterium sp.]|nr:hypothetical protein [Eubacterium sp.]